MNEHGQPANGQAQPASAQAPQPAAKTFPLNRVVAFLGPYVAIVSGVIAAWLVTHFPGLHLNKASLETTITEAIVFVIGAVVTWALHHKWLDGWQRWESALNTPAAPVASLEATLDPSVLATAIPVPAEADPQLSATDEGSGMGAAVDGY